MRLSPRLSVGFLVILLLLWVSSGESVTRLGLHFSTEEKAAWNTRRTTGPYASDYTAILSSATTWRDAPTARWGGQANGVCFSGAAGTTPDRRRDEGMLDAAFVYLVQGTTSYRDVVRDQLLAQAAVAGTDFTDTDRWCPNNPFVGEYGTYYAGWLLRLLYSYDYIRDSLTGPQQTTLDAWFLAAANHFEDVVNEALIKRFPGRLSDNYTCSGFCPGASLGLTHFGGEEVFNFHNGWNNQVTQAASFFSAVGVMQNNTTLKARATKYFQEFIKYSVFPEGQVMDQHRWNGDTPQHAYLYSGQALGSIITIAEHFARNNDLSLYNYSTSDGLFNTEGGPKTLFTAVLHFARLTNGTDLEYASNTATTNAGLVIDSAGTGQTRIEFLNIAMADNRYENAEIQTAYQKTIPGGTIQTVGCEARRGPWCTFPRVLFMFGQMRSIDVHTIGNPIPNPPTSFDATTASATAIDTTWVAPTLNTDGSPLTDLDEYEVSRCSGAGCSNFAPIGTTVSTSFSDTGLTPATLYRYHVVAIDTTGSKSAISNIDEDTTSAGAPSTQRTTQSTFQCGYSGAIVGEELKEAADQDCRIVSPSVVRVITGLRNQTGSNPATTPHNLWCRKNAGTWTELTDDCTSFDLCYSGDDAALQINQVLDAAILPLGGLVYQEGRARRSSISPDSLVVEDGKQVEYLDVLHVKDGLIFGDEFECCQRKSGGIELDSCAPATLIVGASENRNR